MSTTFGQLAKWLSWALRVLLASSSEERTIKKLKKLNTLRSSLIHSQQLFEVTLMTLSSLKPRELELPATWLFWPTSNSQTQLKSTQTCHYNQHIIGEKVPLNNGNNYIRTKICHVTSFISSA